MSNIEQDRLLALLCPECGAPLGGFPENDRCAGLKCTSCSWIGLVTSNPNYKWPGNDPTLYSIWIDSHEYNRMQVIAITANLLCMGVAVARQVLDQKFPVRQDINANEVLRLEELFRRRGVTIRIEPEFPWPFH